MLFRSQQGVKYYLIVDSEKKTIEIFELIKGQYELRADGSDFTFELEEGCTIVPELNNVWENI